MKDEAMTHQTILHAITIPSVGMAFKYYNMLFTAESFLYVAKLRKRMSTFNGSLPFLLDFQIVPHMLVVITATEMCRHTSQDQSVSLACLRVL